MDVAGIRDLLLRSDGRELSAVMEEFRVQGVPVHEVSRVLGGLLAEGAVRVDLEDQVVRVADGGGQSVRVGSDPGSECG